MNILEEANKIVYGDRQEAYDHPKINFQKIVDVVNALLGTDLAASDIVKIMIVIKLVREQHYHQRDNLRDGAGYFEVLARVLGEDE